ncbi:hypothetical protein [Nonomuraea turcica]|uniref:hypothetical protein n=1 Tax=Nonomuraea sp. G32 TaxID=3067274 RepID=UPI00273B24C8|nr:hypothetical protein [Nonomuraea sp. G32]MDP4510592.1 hypothetical protein [Nonomuraea sp. G32]
MRELMELERQKLAIQFAAVEVAIDDKIQFQTKKIVDVVSGAISAAVVQLKEDNLMRDIGLKTHLAVMKGELTAEIGHVRTELKADIADVRTELADVRTELKADIADVKGEIQRLEETVDNHTH